MGQMMDGGPDGYQESSVGVILPATKVEVPTVMDVGYYQAITFNKLHELIEAQAKTGSSSLSLNEPDYKFGSRMIEFLKKKGFTVTVYNNTRNFTTVISW